MNRTVYGVGYIGDGPWKVSHKGIVTSVYKTWNDMLARCYNPRVIDSFPTYNGCSVNPEWHCFQVFADWVNRLKYKCEGWALDKDILLPGNLIYSPQTCVFLPAAINCALRPGAAWGRNLPPGVTYVRSASRSRPYQARIATYGGKQKSLGYFGNPEEAGAAYKIAREKYVHELAREWAGIIDPRAVYAMLSYTLPQVA